MIRPGQATWIGVGLVGGLLLSVACGGSAGNGTANGAPVGAAADVSYDNGTSGLSATDVQAALDALAAQTGQLLGGGGSLPSANQTLFTFAGGGAATEAFAQAVAPRAGTVTQLHVRNQAALAVGANVVITFRVNGVPTGLTVTYTSVDGVATKSDAGPAVPVVAGDLLSFSMAETGGVNPNSFFSASALFR